ncbi:MAG: electron transfer flavoprotein subunit beta/FixA family protein [Candidatus Neomarinimicrobiota bacterium]
MNILICVKVVPDSDTIIKIAPDGKTIDETNIRLAINPYDEYALEAGVQLKEKFGGEVTVISVGDENAAGVIKKCLPVGADKALHLIAPNSRMADALSIARMLADEIRNHPFDIIFCGKTTIDAQNGLVGELLGSLLNIPVISAASQFSIDGNRAVVSRDVDGTKEIVECALPCLVTAEKGLTKPRYPSLREIMLAKKKQIDSRPVVLGDPNLCVLGMEYPPNRPPGKIVGEGVGAVPELVRLLTEEAKVL